jgi:hypothetical protein
MSPTGTQLAFSLQTRGLSCSFFEDSPDIFEKIVSATEDAVKGRKRQPRLSVRFVQEKQSLTWHYWLESGSRRLLDDGSFPLPRRQMNELAKRSAKLGSMREWLPELASIGEELRQLIFQNNERFQTAFRMALENAGGIEKARFSFDIEQKMFSLAVEALVGPEPQIGHLVAKQPHPKKARRLNSPQTGKGGNRRTQFLPEIERQEVERLPFWMLKAPIYRSLTVTPALFSLGQARPPLFEDQLMPINCLIIEADVSGRPIVPGFDGLGDLPELSSIDVECERLKSCITAAQRNDRWQVAQVKHLNRASVPPGQSFKRHLEDTLKERDWHLVHFAGHSLYLAAKDGLSGRGLLLLPGPGGEIEMLNAGLFANWLARAQFLFLSGCRTCEENFVFEMAKNYVPAVLGYRWPVEDQMATDFALKFYEGLFRVRSIEQAFVDARNRVWKEHGVNEQIWAAPMLVLLDSHRFHAAA